METTIQPRPQRKRRRGGASVAVASLILIALMAGYITFQVGASISYLVLQQSVAVKDDAARQRMAEQPNIINAQIAASGANATLTFTNYGSETALIDHIWVITLSDASIHQSWPVSPPLSVYPGATISYNFIPTGKTLNPSAVYLFKAVTRRGNIAAIRYPSTATASSGSSRPWALNFIPGTLESNTAGAPACYTSGTWIAGTVAASSAKTSCYRITVVNTSNLPITISSASAVSIYSAYTSVGVGARLTRAVIGGTTYTVDATHPLTIPVFVQAVLIFGDVKGTGNLVSNDACFVLATFVAPAGTFPFYSQTLVIDAILTT